MNAPTVDHGSLSLDDVRTFAASLAELSDADITAHVAEAELPALLASLAYLTGDTTLLADKMRAPLNPMEAEIQPQGGMSSQAQEEAKALAVSTLQHIRDGELGLGTAVEPDLTERVMQFLAPRATQEYMPLLVHELGLHGDVGAPAWTKEDIAGDRDFTVAVIGAGMSGIAAAVRLQQAGVSFTVFEKNEDVGGTWLENQYPGCRLDTNNFAYSYSFSQKGNWPHQFSEQPQIRAYFADVAKKNQLHDSIQFATTVRSMQWDSDSAKWTLHLADKAGSEQTITVNAVISAVGQLNQPNYPDIPGLDRFRGLSMHSATWDPATDITGLRVGVVGTGASAYQIVPSIADQVGELRVFQRSAPWMLPTPGYHRPISLGLSWLFNHVPTYHQWFRFWQFWVATEGRFHLIGADPEWTEPDSVSAANAELRRQLLDHLARQYPTRPDLLEKVTPNYVAGAKRMLRDNGVWAEALHKPHVHLVTDRIDEITEKGILTADGVEHELDVIVYATGFRASDFLSPMQVTGVDGVDLHEQWDGDPSAYLGITVPRFPNLFCIYGPNTNLVVTGSIIYMAECAVEYSIECLRTVLAGGFGSIDTTQVAYDKYSDWIDEENRTKAWGVPNAQSWYKNANGRVTQNWPFPLLTYWNLTRSVDSESVVLS